jgi:hypothetical protein
MTHQFDLEQQILDCWGITDDLQTLIDRYDAMSEDDKLNVLIGLKTLYHMKFERTFETFEKLISQQHLEKQIAKVHFPEDQ